MVRRPVVVAVDAFSATPGLYGKTALVFADPAEARRAAGLLMAAADRAELPEELT